VLQNTNRSQLNEFNKTDSRHMLNLFFEKKNEHFDGNGIGKVHNRIDLSVKTQKICDTS